MNMYEVSLTFSDIEAEDPADAARAYVAIIRDYLDGAIGSLMFDVRDNESGEWSFPSVKPEEVPAE